MKQIKKELESVLSEILRLAKKAELMIQSLESGTKTGAKVKQKQMTEKHSQVDRGGIIKIIKHMRKEGHSFEKIAQHLDSKGIPTFSGVGKWRKQTVHKLFHKMT